MNQREEQRVIEALRAHTGGLTVTDHDIIDARSRLQQRLAPSRPPRRRTALAVAAAAVALVAGVATWLVVDSDGSSEPAPADDPKTPVEVLRAALQEDTYAASGEQFLAGRTATASDLTGLWLLRAPYGPILTSFSPDERLWMYGPAERESDAVAYSLDDGVLAISPAAGTDCPTTRWTTAIAPDSSLRLEFTTGENTCTPTDNRGVYDPLTPGASPVAEFLEDAATSADYVVQPNVRLVPGVYYAPESGHLLVVEGNRYRYYTSAEVGAAPADRGRLDQRTEDGGAVVAATCQGGGFTGTLDAGMTPAAGSLIPSLSAVRLAAADTCASGVSAELHWVLMSAF